METIQKIKVKDELKIEDNSVVRYAWGNSQMKTWFITKNKKAFMPKGSKLLFVIIGKLTQDKIHITATYPVVGDVICDTNFSHIKVNEVNWI